MLMRMLLLSSILCSSPVFAQERSYHLTIAEQSMSMAGRAMPVLTINGAIPATTLEAIEGDVLHITVDNQMNAETSLHWHGLLVPNDQDGVPYMTTPPIAAHGKAEYRFPLRQHGTYWYHAHSGLQEQRGLFGGIVIHPKADVKQPKVDKETLLLWSDWTNENPDEVLSHLKSDGDYYAMKKGSVVSWLGAVEHGDGAVTTLLKGAWDRMGPMDVSDVGYDAFLVNGKPQLQDRSLKAGQTVRMRMVNASASTYMDVAYAGGQMTVVAADGKEVQPFKVDRLQMTMAENYDVLLTVPEGGAYELRASANDGTGYASYLLGDGALHFAPTYPKPDLYADHTMTMQVDGKDVSMNMIMSGVDYSQLKSPEPTEFSENRPVREHTLHLTGNMERYVWSFDNKLLDEADKILVKKGEVVRFRLVNDSMMEHPLHLHGHFFRVLNGQGAYSPLKHTVNVPPMGEVSIEFAADEEKDWFFHCHNLYHMASGMARIVHYQQEGESEHATHKMAAMGNMKHGDGWFFNGNIALQSSMWESYVRASDARNIIEIENRSGYDGSYEITPAYVRPLTQYLSVFGGAEIKKERNDEQSEAVGVTGLRYTLPMMIDVEARMDDEGHGRLEFGSELQLAQHVALGWYWNTDKEYQVNADMLINERAALRISYDSDYHAGAGVVWKF